MSYILNALRKAERERQSAPAGDFLAADPATASAPDSGWQNRLAVVLALLLGACLLALAAVLVLDRDGRNADVPVASTPVPTPSVEDEHLATSERPRAARTIDEPRYSSGPVAGGGDKPAVADVVSGSAPQGLEAAPSSPSPEHGDGQSQRSPPPLPKLNVTGYIFFEDAPERSKLFVDGIVYRLDSRLATGLVLTGFRRDHVILSHYGVERRLAVQ